MVGSAKLGKKVTGTEQNVGRPWIIEVSTSFLEPKKTEAGREALAFLLAFWHLLVPKTFIITDTIQNSDLY